MIAYKACPLRLPLIIVLILFLYKPSVFAASPEEMINTLVARSLEIIQDASRTNEEKRRILQMLLIDHCDSREIAERVLGVHYKKFASRVPEFAPLFIELISRIYAERILKESEDKKIAIQFLGARGEGDWSEIEAEVFSGSERYRITYWLKNTSGQWRIVDVSLEGFGLVRNYRVQIAHWLRKSSFDDLLQKLRKILEHL